MYYSKLIYQIYSTVTLTKYKLLNLDQMTERRLN
jgi:hypothetical protein